MRSGCARPAGFGARLRREACIGGLTDLGCEGEPAPSGRFENLYHGRSPRAKRAQAHTAAAFRSR